MIHTYCLLLFKLILMACIILCMSGCNWASDYYRNDFDDSIGELNRVTKNIPGVARFDIVQEFGRNNSGTVANYVDIFNTSSDRIESMAYRIEFFDQDIEPAQLTALYDGEVQNLGAGEQQPRLVLNNFNKVTIAENNVRVTLLRLQLEDSMVTQQQVDKTIPGLVIAHVSQQLIKGSGGAVQSTNNSVAFTNINADGFSTLDYLLEVYPSRVFTENSFVVRSINQVTGLEPFVPSEKKLFDVAYSGGLDESIIEFQVLGTGREDIDHPLAGFYEGLYTVFNEDSTEYSTNQVSVVVNYQGVTAVRLAGQGVPLSFQGITDRANRFQGADLFSTAIGLTVDGIADVNGGIEFALMIDGHEAWRFMRITALKIEI